MACFKLFDWTFVNPILQGGSICSPVVFLMKIN